MSQTLKHAFAAQRPRLDSRAAKMLRLRIVLGGLVQGLGVRPAIARLAQELRLAGQVANSTAGLTIEIQGDAAAVSSFCTTLARRLPLRARIDTRSEQFIDTQDDHDFRIVASTVVGALAATVPTDLGTCQECLAEARDAGSRRRDFAFTTCTGCGPRYSLIERMPFDRSSTSMRYFQPCATCQQEYFDPDSRRFHSQTDSCPQCGPRLWLTSTPLGTVAEGHRAIRQSSEVLLTGQILALRGVGGYQLLVDATNPRAIQELRTRKKRFGKPLAVMVSDVAAAERIAVLTDEERELLTDSANPIVVVRSRTPAKVAQEVTCGLNTIGILLPTTALHDELLRTCRVPLVVTSGNIEGEPIAFSRDANSQLAEGLADARLDHDRPIIRPIDDSVVRVVAGRAATIRLARGLAPLSLRIKSSPILALGGHQKSAIALSNGAQAVLGPHIGDLDGETGRVRYLEHLAAMCELYDVRPELLVVDQHPDYFTSRWAAEQSTPRMAVQHHHAHVVAAMVEYDLLEREVLGIAWDGTGYGSDGTIWGGEFLHASAVDFRRLASIRPFVLPGGERAVREPWRIAVALAYEAAGPERAASLRFPDVAIADVERLVQMLGNQSLWPVTSSAGRLFDGVAALALNLAHAHYEAQLAMLLEAACDTSAMGDYPWPLRSDQPATLDWRGMVADILADREKGIAPGIIAMRFHRTLAGGIASLVKRNPGLPVVLCGGCFQNRVLTELAVERLAQVHEAFTPGVIPSGDGGLAAGQLAIAATRIAKGWSSCA
jgi:hydrogenase maturation protein HypF